MLHQYFFTWDSATAEFQRAVRLRDPDDSEPLVAYGRHLLFYGRIADGLEAFLTARQTEPASAVVTSWVAYAYFLQGKMDSAVVESARSFENDPRT